MALTSPVTIAARVRPPRSPRPVNVIFICMGNICRSPMAAAVLQQQVTEAGLDHISVSSAGTGGWHVGDPADRRARAALEARGYPADHEARQFQPGWFDRYELVIALDRDNQRDLRRMAPSTSQADAVRLLLEFDPEAESLDVPDPYYGATSDFETVLDQIEEACRGLTLHLQDSSLARGRASL